MLTLLFEQTASEDAFKESGCRSVKQNLRRSASWQSKLYRERMSLPATNLRPIFVEFKSLLLALRDELFKELVREGNRGIRAQPNNLLRGSPPVNIKDDSKHFRFVAEDQTEKFTCSYAIVVTHLTYCSTLFGLLLSGASQHLPACLREPRSNLMCAEPI